MNMKSEKLPIEILCGGAEIPEMIRRGTPVEQDKTKLAGRCRMPFSAKGKPIPVVLKVQSGAVHSPTFADLPQLETCNLQPGKCVNMKTYDHRTDWQKRIRKN